MKAISGIDHKIVLFVIIVVVFKFIDVVKRQNCCVSALCLAHELAFA